MNVQTFLMAVGSALLNMVVPKCNNILESSVAGTIIFSQIYKALKYASEHEKELKEAGIVDKNGMVDIDLASFAIYHGVRFPIQVGPFIFRQDDWSEIINIIKPKVCNAEVIK